MLVHFAFHGETETKTMTRFMDAWEKTVQRVINFHGHLLRVISTFGDRPNDTEHTFCFQRTQATTAPLSAMQCILHSAHGTWHSPAGWATKVKPAGCNPDQATFQPWQKALASNCLVGQSFLRRLLPHLDDVQLVVSSRKALWRSYVVSTKVNGSPFWDFCLSNPQDYGTGCEHPVPAESIETKWSDSLSMSMLSIRRSDGLGQARAD